MPGEGKVGAPVRAVCTDLYGPVENPFVESYGGGLLQSFREQMRSFHDLLRQKRSSLFILLGWSSNHLPDDVVHVSEFGEEVRGSLPHRIL